MTEARYVHTYVCERGGNRMDGFIEMEGRDGMYAYGCICYTLYVWYSKCAVLRETTKHDTVLSSNHRLPNLLLPLTFYLSAYTEMYRVVVLCFGRPVKQGEPRR